jgi:hypothetical protein
MAEPELRPVPLERRNALPRWEVWLDGRRLGWIQEKHLRGARLQFFQAIAPHPRTGRPISLELHTDRDDRVQVLVEFAEEPERYGQHWT